MEINDDGEMIYSAIEDDVEAIFEAQVTAYTLIEFLEDSLKTSTENGEFMYDKRVRLIRMAVEIEHSLDEMRRVLESKVESQG